MKRILLGLLLCLGLSFGDTLNTSIFTDYQTITEKDKKVIDWFLNEMYKNIKNDLEYSYNAGHSFDVDKNLISIAFHIQCSDKSGLPRLKDEEERKVFCDTIEPYLPQKKK